MPRIKFNRPVYISLIAIALPLAASLNAADRSAAKLAVGADAQREVMVTVYNNNYGLVREVRELSLPEGIAEVEFRDVAEKIDPTSVAIKPLSSSGSFTVLEQNYRYDLLNPQVLMDKFVGKTIKITSQRMVNNSQVSETREGTLLSTSNGTIMRFNDSYEINPQGSITLEKVPEELLSKPTLVWLLKSSGGDKQTVETSYLTNDMNWHADYVAVINADDTKLDLNGWVTLDNKSGAAYRNATLKLIAGDVQRIMEPRAPDLAARARTMAAAAPEQQFAEKSFFEYHMYTLDRPATLANNETKQLSLLEGHDIPVRKLFVFDSTPWTRSAGPRWSEKNKVAVMIEFENKKQNNLGIPLPKGRIRVYKGDTDNSRQLVGEDFLGHTPRDEKVRLKLGEAFDVVGERIQTDYKKLADRISELTFSISLRNHKDEDIQVTIVEHAYGDWEVVKESHPHVKKDAQTLEFNVPVPKNGETTVTYTFRVEL
ncbi:DUF4139 domain-containing protein [Candidatus Sumerlaeota bacterium]|nr:DUF4139 domain-containing protein [Candidatus Sumerlaeota bacterium]